MYKKTQIRDVITIIILSVVVFILSSAFDILESIIIFSEKNEKWEIDEIITVSIFLVFALSVFSFRRWHEVRIANDELTCANNKLRISISEIKRLRGILPICAQCKRIRDDAGYWHQVESYVREHTDANFTHSLCPNCTRELYPELIKDKGQCT